MAFAKLNFREIIDARENGNEKYSDDALIEMVIKRFEFLCALENKHLFIGENECLFFGDYEEYDCVSKRGKYIWEETQMLRKIIETM